MCSTVPSRDTLEHFSLWIWLFYEILKYIVLGTLHSLHTFLYKIELKKPGIIYLMDKIKEIFQE